MLAIVAIAMVAAQGYGGLHRIEHAHLAGAGLFEAAQDEHGHGHAHAHDHDHGHGHDDDHAGHFDPDAGGRAEHNCAAIDALALGDGPPATATLAPGIRPVGAARFTVAVLPASHARPCPFEARAPPRLTS
jgi:hypothetical protein